MEPSGQILLSLSFKTSIMIFLFCWNSWNLIFYLISTIPLIQNVAKWRIFFIMMMIETLMMTMKTTTLATTRSKITRTKMKITKTIPMKTTTMKTTLTNTTTTKTTMAMPMFFALCLYLCHYPHTTWVSVVSYFMIFFYYRLTIIMLFITVALS